MKKMTNPLDRISIASPCGANWDEMRGDARRRYCARCRLNVYNLSEMTRDEAESFLINSEGRVCVRVFRRADGSVITEDCPVGWARVKRKVARTGAAVLALIAGFFGGLFALGALQALRDFTNYDRVPEPFFRTEEKPEEIDDDDGKAGEKISFGGGLSNLNEVRAAIRENRKA